MKTSLLFQYLERFAHFSDEEKALAQNFLNEIRLYQGDSLILESQVPDRTFFINSGTLMLYLSGNRKTRPIKFLTGGLPLIPVGFFTQQPVPYSIKALEDAMLLSMHINTYRPLSKNNPQIKDIIISIQDDNTRRDLQIGEILNHSSNKDKIMFLEENYPHLSRFTPTAIRAAFLNLDETTYFRLRKRLYKAK